MHGSRITYIVQIRIQDYWMDCAQASFQDSRDVYNRIKVLQEQNPREDFQVIKRTTIFKDELLLES